jgi:hypothetical protein
MSVTSTMRSKLLESEAMHAVGGAVGVHAGTSTTPEGKASLQFVKVGVVIDMQLPHGPGMHVDTATSANKDKDVRHSNAHGPVGLDIN